MSFKVIIVILCCLPFHLFVTIYYLSYNLISEPVTSFNYVNVLSSLCHPCAVTSWTRLRPYICYYSCTMGIHISQPLLIAPQVSLMISKLTDCPNRFQLCVWSDILLPIISELLQVKPISSCIIPAPHMQTRLR